MVVTNADRPTDQSASQLNLANMAAKKRWRQKYKYTDTGKHQLITGGFNSIKTKHKPTHHTPSKWQRYGHYGQVHTIWIENIGFDGCWHRACFRFIFLLAAVLMLIKCH